MSHYWKRNVERNKLILADYQINPDLKSIASKHGIGLAACRDVLKGFGLTFPKSVLRKYGKCTLNKELVLKMCSEGASLAEIGKAIGTGGRHVKRFLRKNGVTRDFPNTRPGHKNWNWKGGRTIDKNGYIALLRKDHPNARKHTGYVFEHRLVMEQMIGRILLPNEVVHHKDGNKQNNHPSNLQLFSENSEHLAHELKGRVPKWTPDGLERIKKGAAKGVSVIRAKSKPSSHHP